MSELFEIYFNELVDWNNNKHKLTGHTEKEDVYNRLFKDALLSFESFDLNNKKILDVGAGAGFPSVPLLIENESIDLTIVESMKKRTDFLEHLRSKLGIEFNIINERIEETDLKDEFDIVTARAVARLNILLEITIPYLKIGGLGIFVKGPKAEEELEEAHKAIKELGCEFVDILEIDIPGGFKNKVIVVKKVMSTNSKYPRQFSQIKKQPL